MTTGATLLSRADQLVPTVDSLVAAIEAALPDLQSRCLMEEKAGRLSEETILKLDEIGVFRMSVPLEYGGLAFNTEEQLKVYTAVGKIAGSTGWVAWNSTSALRWIAMYSEQTRQEIYGMTDWRGPLVCGVVNSFGPGRARSVEGGFMVQGKWPFCSSCQHTAWYTLGALCPTADGTAEAWIMLVPREDIRILDDWAVSGMKATGSNTVQIVEEVFVPAHRAIRVKDALNGDWAAPPPKGQLVFQNHFITFVSLLSGATPLGMAKGALDYYMSRIRKRGISATDYEVQADAPITHLQLADAVSRIDAAELVLTKHAIEIDRRASAGEAWDDMFRTKLRFDVANAVRGCTEAIEILHRGSGASTIHENNPMQRFARDARVATVHAQFNYETCAEDYGRVLCGKPTFGNFAKSARPQ
ncbi:acyl-CoA dehydrogenase family protein [Paraburkholderia sp.]|uniref:acyl-CoA dehydrogenase family protein n=1 Tax=Paraburkholderia sp. TaxID=1926495 RepID=UPI003C7BFC53